MQGAATVTRASAAAAIALQVNDPIFKNDALQTAANATLGITFDDETTFSLSPSTRIVVDEFVYQEGGSANAAVFMVTTGTAAFVASLVAQTGDMKIATPTASLGIRGTTGVVDVPTQGAAGEPRIKLYADADGHVGRIEVFDRQGGRLGALTQGASAFALRAGAGGRLAAVPFQIPPQEAARDRGMLQRLFVSHRSDGRWRSSAGRCANATGNCASATSRASATGKGRAIRGSQAASGRRISRIARAAVSICGRKASRAGPARPGASRIARSRRRLRSRNCLQYRGPAARYAGRSVAPC